ncbi:hypothetical protein AGR1C_Cc11070 [Agrobacterium fabacearum TT111]|nr:hypothetical protein AGR1C_Cc11070 [Agrobacterium fabacearum TT111]
MVFLHAAPGSFKLLAQIRLFRDEFDVPGDFP